MLAARRATLKVPNPTKRTSSPLFNARLMASNTPSTARPASAFDIPELPATVAIISFLFTVMAPSLTVQHCPTNLWRNPAASPRKQRARAGSVNGSRRARQLEMANFPRIITLSAAADTAAFAWTVRMAVGRVAAARIPRPKAPRPTWGPGSVGDDVGAVLVGLRPRDRRRVHVFIPLDGFGRRNQRRH